MLTDFVKDVTRILKEDGNEVLSVEFETKEDYYDVMNYIDGFLDNDIKVYGVDKDKPIVIFQREPDMIAEHELGEMETEEIMDEEEDEGIE